MRRSITGMVASSSARTRTISSTEPVGRAPAAAAGGPSSARPASSAASGARRLASRCSASGDSSLSQAQARRRIADPASAASIAAAAAACSARSLAASLSAPWQLRLRAPRAAWSRRLPRARPGQRGVGRFARAERPARWPPRAGSARQGGAGRRSGASILPDDRGGSQGCSSRGTIARRASPGRADAARSPGRRTAAGRPCRASSSMAVGAADQEARLAPAAVAPALELLGEFDRATAPCPARRAGSVTRVGGRQRAAVRRCRAAR